MGEAENTAVIFLEDFKQIDRLKYFLRKKIPYKVYFVYNTDVSDKIPQEELKKELKKELTQWVAKNATDAEMNLFSFEDCFPKLLKIIIPEIKRGRNVNIALHAGSIITATAAVMVSALTGAKAFWVKPEKWVSSGKKFGDPRILLPVGASKIIEVKLPITPKLPTAPHSHILVFIFNNNSVVTGKLVNLVEKIGLEKISTNLKKPSSGTVKLSKIISKLREDGLVETKRTSSKSLEISLTGQGKLIAEILKTME